MKKVELAKEVIQYKLLNEKQKKELDNHIELLWLDMSKYYVEICNKDKEYIKTFEELQRLHAITKYNIDDDYSEYNVDEAEEFVNDAPLEFQKSVYKEHSYIFKHYDELTKDVTEQINKLKSLKFVFNKENKIKKLELKLDYYKSCYEFFNKCQERLNLKKYYVTNYNSLVKPVEDKYMEILLKNAKVVVKDAIEKNPVIISKPHSENSRWGCLNEMQGNTLNKVFNELYKTIEQGIEKKVTTKMSR